MGPGAVVVVKSGQREGGATDSGGTLQASTLSYCRPLCAYVVRAKRKERPSNGGRSPWPWGAPPEGQFAFVISAEKRGAPHASIVSAIQEVRMRRRTPSDAMYPTSPLSVSYTHLTLPTTERV